MIFLKVALWNLCLVFLLGIILFRNIFSINLIIFFKADISYLLSHFLLITDLYYGVCAICIHTCMIELCFDSLHDTSTIQTLTLRFPFCTYNLQHA